MHLTEIKDDDQSSSESDDDVGDPTSDSDPNPTLDTKYIYCSAWVDPVAKRAANALNSEKATMVMVSDGSVKDITTGGTWAWALIWRDLCTEEMSPWGIEGSGREKVRGLDTAEAHSYRMEALGLLSALRFLRTEIKWNVKLDWYIDSDEAKKHHSFLAHQHQLVDTYCACKHYVARSMQQDMLFGNNAKDIPV